MSDHDRERAPHHEPDVIEHLSELAGEELCAICRIDEVQLVEYLRHGIVIAIDDNGRRFAGAAVSRVIRARRVQREFAVELDALGLVLDLLERIDAQRRELERLRLIADAAGR